jgi:hypothetical protein
VRKEEKRRGAIKTYTRMAISDARAVNRVFMKISSHPLI